jgi:hypothetical protein
MFLFAAGTSWDGGLTFVQHNCFAPEGCAAKRPAPAMAMAALFFKSSDIIYLCRIELLATQPCSCLVLQMHIDSDCLQRLLQPLLHPPNAESVAPVHTPADAA